MAENVRAALVLVARGEAPLGIVYETDAKVDPSVKIIGVFPENSHPPIIYPVAMTRDAKPDAAQYLAFLTTPEAKSVLNDTAFAYWRSPRIDPDSGEAVPAILRAELRRSGAVSVLR